MQNTSFTRNMLRMLCLLILALLDHGNADAASQTYTGVFQGQGRACFGKLFLRKKTIEWNSSFSVCKPVAYTILKIDMDSASPHIAVLLKHKNKTCRQAVIAMTLDPAFPQFWLVQGYTSQQDYEHRKEEDVDARTLSCGMQKLD
ncbi:hypothetical protein [Undibacterium sp. TS12]|uniref:hypothetical protein n=1 Tax=Undibacterium sp. TS12 TaxID=2908202 RepID=UPI001F4CD62D|nr:hypothetical protein [Undibacterium sp. TS12]MCH8620363.1 hypothetical protein [Undibacterium sp. TS12]